MRAEYDFSGGARGKYADRYRRGVNVILLEPEVAAAFPDSNSVNEALRAILEIADRNVKSEACLTQIAGRTPFKTVAQGEK